MTTAELECASIPSSVVTYASPLLTLRRRVTSHTTFGVEDISGSYSYSPEKRWYRDVMLMGLSQQGRRILTSARERTSPVTAATLDKIVRTALLNNCSGSPDRLRELLSYHPAVKELPRGFSLSVPLTFYHASGMFKDVYFLLCVLIPTSKVAPLSEVGLAIKIGKAPDAISETEINYSVKLHGGGSQSPLSHVLGSVDLGAFPELNMPGRTMLVEAFEPGEVVGRYLNGKNHLAAASAVSRCLFRLAKQAAKVGLGSLDCNLQSRSTNILRAKIPTDINPGNFIIGAGNNAVLIDPGACQPIQSFSQIILRLIATYWTYEHSRQNGMADRYLLKLHPLFREATQCFGSQLGTRLLEEVMVNLGFMTGTPVRLLRERYPRIDVDGVGEELARLYSYNSEAGQKGYISSNIALERPRYLNQIRSAVEHNDSELELRLMNLARAAPFLLSTNQLSKVAKSLQSFLRHETEGVVVPRLNGVSAKPLALIKKLRSDIHLATKHLGSARTLNFISFATHLSPFPDPSVLSLAMVTAAFRRDKRKDDGINTPSWIHHQELLLRLAIFFHNMFSNPEFTAIAAKIAGSNIGAAFIKEARLQMHLKHHRSADYRAFLGQWIALFVGLHHLYQNHGVAVIDAFEDRVDQFARELPQLYESGPDAVLKLLYRTLIEGINPEEINFEDVAREVIVVGAQRLQELLVKRGGFEKNAFAMPCFVEPYFADGEKPAAE